MLSFSHRRISLSLKSNFSGVLLLSTLAFFLITSVTALIVRVLTSSGVVFMFPLFTFFRTMGLPGADERILSLSYPWIGTARMAIANQHIHPQRHLVWAHCMKIVLYYVMYEACQAGETSQLGFSFRAQSCRLTQIKFISSSNSLECSPVRQEHPRGTTSLDFRLRDDLGILLNGICSICDVSPFLPEVDTCVFLLLPR